MKRMLGMLVGSAFIAVTSTTTTPADETRPALRELPPLMRAVSDEPGVLLVAQGRALSQRIAEIEQATGVKLVALVVVTIAPESVEAYAQRLIDHWKRQSRALDSGRFVFVVIAKNDRELRIVPGPGLAWVLKPLSGNRMMENVSPLLRKDRYYEALLTIVDGLSRIITDRQQSVRLNEVPKEPGYGAQRERG